MRLLLFLLLSLSCPNLKAQASIDQLITPLYQKIGQKELFIQQKEQYIQKLKSELIYKQEPLDRFQQYDKIFESYSSYQHDSSYVYATFSLQEAHKTALPDQLLKAKSNLLFCFLSAGAFKEANDIVLQTNTQGASLLEKGNYYALCARLFSDMYGYTDLPAYKIMYQERNNVYCDSAMMYLSPQSYTYHKIKALRIKDRPLQQMIDAYQSLLHTFSINNHEKAIVSSNLANLYLGKGDTLTAISYLVNSAIADIEEAVMETTAKTTLAECLYQLGEINAANIFIHQSLAEANFYNAKHRILNINRILPIIEQAHTSQISSQRDQFQYLLYVVSLLLVLCTLAFVIAYRQKKRLEIAQDDIVQQRSSLQQINLLLQERNKQLKQLDDIKDTYIIESLYAKSAYLDRIEDILKKMDYRIKSRQYNDLTRLHREFNIRQERKELFLTFDRAFLTLFPDFINAYNQLFYPEDHIHLESNGSLPAEVRIFALIRLGIHENEKIANFLNLSINTIYAYKTKVKGKSRISKQSKEQFEDLIRNIAQREG